MLHLVHDRFIACFASRNLFFWGHATSKASLDVDTRFWDVGQRWCEGCRSRCRHVGSARGQMCRQSLPRPAAPDIASQTSGCRRTAGKPCLLTIRLYVTFIMIRPSPGSPDVWRILNRASPCFEARLYFSLRLIIQPAVLRKILLQLDNHGCCHSRRP